MNMEPVWSPTTDRILGVGRLLTDIGVRNWVLSKPEALSALDELAAAEIGVLGGDVYEMLQDRMRPTRDNWYCNRQPGETNGAFVARSITQARDYIRRYSSERATTVFAIVPER